MLIGSHDRTVCLHCGGGLKDWLPIDDPCTEHAAWFPVCDYVRFINGQTYIRDCQYLRTLTNRPTGGIVLVNGHMLTNNEVE